MFGGIYFGGAPFAGLIARARERVRVVTGWGPPAAASLPHKDVLLEPEPLLTLAIGVPPAVNPQDPFVPDEAEELLVLLAGV